MKNDVVRWNATEIQYVIKNNINEESKNSKNIISDKTLKHLNVANNASQQHVVETSTTATLSAITNNAANNEERLWWGGQPRANHHLQQQQQHQTSASSAIKCDNNNDKSFNENNINFLVLHKLKHSPRTKSRQCSYEIRRHPNRCHRHSLHHNRHQSRTFSNKNTNLSLNKISSLCLQFSVVIFFCTFNIGFALAANVGVPVASAALDIVEISPYGLVYDVNSNDIDSSAPLVNTDGHYTHTWAVHIPNGDQGVADEVARDHGFVNLGKIFDDHYHFAHHKVSKRSLTPASTHQTRLDDDHRVHRAVQQKAKSRRKRDYIEEHPSRVSRAVSRGVSLVDVVPLSDPKWAYMWYLNRGGGLDMNVIPAWKEGITGKGIVVTILDDGLESDHPDIEKNYDPKASYDVNSHDDDPMPHYDMTDSNRHGTRCAGEVAATANNSICAVGIAYGASVGGVRMLDGDVTDAVEARSLSLNPQHIDIYSASWGPDDDGKTVDGPGELASRAFIEGVSKGRNGKGSIFIWASGNGGRELDNCNCDGYTNSIWTLSISSATEEGHVPWYSEKCSSTLATTYSSGGQSEKQVVTTDLHHSCTVSHTGTSASAPLAAGIAALVLESNQNLTWRDLQHIVVRTAKPANLKDPSWSKNGIGRRISHSFGYGLMDAAAMVRTARSWKTVPEQQRCEINAPHVDKVIPPRSYITLQLTVKHCLSVNYLEHVQAKITLTSQRRGDIQLYLKSPAGTKVTLLTSRVHDVSRSGFNQWPFMSVHTWGESPHGNWQLEIHNEGRYMGHALLREWSLIFYGTTLPIDPSDPISTPRANSAENTTPNSANTASTTTNLHQIYSPQYPRISSPNNFGIANVGSIGKVAIKLPPNKSVYVAAAAAAGNSNNPLLMNGAGNNKKQQSKQQSKQQLQSYQQISATYGVILGSQNKNNNNNKGNNGKGKGKSGENGNGKGNKNANAGGGGGGGGGGNGGGAGGGGSKSMSNKKEQISGASTKNKFYRILQQQQQNMNNNKSNGKSSQQNGITQRPKLSQHQQSHEKFNSYEDKINRKIVIGDLPSPSNTQQQKISSSKAATSSTQTTSYSKLPVKATKQVKESAASNLPIAPPPPPAPPQQTHEKLTLADQRIPKLFEHYEKIQAIFPEFQPYQGPKEKEITVSSAADKRKMQQQMQNYEAETFRPISMSNSGSKPSRENSKKSSQSSFLPDQKIIKKQQLLLAAAGVSGGTQRPMSVGGGGVSPNRKSTNAQITQWDLIFYGTEAPAQPEDPVHINPGQFGAYGNDMEHNDIEYDASGQWRNMQQIGESGGVMANDKTNTSCLKATIDQRCLDCAPPTYIFNGRCYSECPPHTYINSTTKATNRTLKSNELNDNSLSGSSSSSSSSTSDADDELQSTDRRKRELSESDDMLSSSSLSSSMPELSCAICDTSCQRCYGPLNSECSTCPPGSQLRKPLAHSNETYCYVFAERSSGNSQDVGGAFSSNSRDGDGQTSSYGKRSDLALFLLILVPAMVLGSLIVLLTPYARNWLRLIRSGNVSVSDIFAGNAGATLNGLNSIVTYDRVALFPDDPEDLDQDDQNVGVAVYKDEINKFNHPTAIEFIPAAGSEEEDEDEEVDLFDAGNLERNLTLAK